MSGERTFNGVDADTGQYLRAPATEEEFVKLIRDEPLDDATLRDYEWILERFGIDDPNRAEAQDVDPTSLASAGWGVIFAPGITSGIETALEPLLLRRRHQAGVHFKKYIYAAEPSGEKESIFTPRLHEPGPADPKKMPYYLLIVGSPEEIPFRFQYALSVTYAVGRIYFDNEEGYGAYAQNVVQAEEAAERESDALPARRMAFFSVSHPGDRATERSERELIQPLAEKIAADRSGWPRDVFSGEQATKEQLKNLLGGGATPSLLFTSSHGMSYPSGDPRQKTRQGALLCWDWPGVGHTVLPEHYFSGDDLPADANLRGLIAFHFACYSGGTPDISSFVDDKTGEPVPIAPKPFISHLAQKLLSHPQGALAVIGHVDRAWTTSFGWSDRGQVGIFENTVKRLLDGEPVGHAMEYFSHHHALMSVRYTLLTEDRDALGPGNPGNLARTFRANNDARNFMVLGDPAVRVAYREPS